MIESILVASFAALWGWFVLQFDDSPWPIRTIRDFLKYRVSKKLTVCPWCIGAWFSIIGVVLLHTATHQLNWILTPISAFASAGLTGFLAMLIPDDGEPN